MKFVLIEGKLFDWFWKTQS